MTWVICSFCGAVVAPDGPDGLIVHIVAEHPETPDGQYIIRELASLPLPEPVR